jgi:hypothetical protein
MGYEEAKESHEFAQLSDKSEFEDAAKPDYESKKKH